MGAQLEARRRREAAGLMRAGNGQNLVCGWPKGKPRNHDRVHAVPFGLDPKAPVHRGPGKMPWREGPSKIRGPDGLLLPVPRSIYYRREVDGERMRSTRWFKVEAQRYLAAAAAGDRNALRCLEMIRASCAAFLEAKRQGISLDDKIVLEVEPKVSPAEARREARRMGGGRYLADHPCRRCGSFERFTHNARCVNTGYFAEERHG